MQILSYVWLLFLAMYLLLITFNDVTETYTVKALTSKFTWICYTLFDVTVIKCLRANGDKIAKILTQGNRISCVCDRINGERPLHKKVFHMIVMLKFLCYNMKVLKIYSITRN